MPPCFDLLVRHAMRTQRDRDSVCVSETRSGHVGMQRWGPSGARARGGGPKQPWLDLAVLPARSCARGAEEPLQSGLAASLERRSLTGPAGLQ